MSKTLYPFELPLEMIYPEHILPTLDYEKVEMKIPSFRRHLSEIKMVRYGVVKDKRGGVYYKYTSATPIVLAVERMVISMTVAISEESLQKMGPGEVALATLLDSATSVRGYEKIAQPSPSVGVVGAPSA
jgi:hypothetical protein